MKFAVFISGNGSNLQAIIDAVQSKKITADLNLVVSNKSDVYGLERAKKAGIETAVFERKDYVSLKKREEAIVDLLKKKEIDFVVLAGYMVLFTPYFIQQYPNRILNIHPSLLPDFKGAHGIKDAFESGVQKTGVTVHLVDEEMDHGPIIKQQDVLIDPTDTLDSLEEKIHAVEHVLYPEVIQSYIENFSQS